MLRRRGTTDDWAVLLTETVGAISSNSWIITFPITMQTWEQKSSGECSTTSVPIGFFFSFTYVPQLRIFSYVVLGTDGLMFPVNACEQAENCWTRPNLLAYLFVFSMARICGHQLIDNESKVTSD